MITCDWRFAFTRIQIEYIEMPDLKLTLAQVRRLCNLSQDVCEPAVAALEQAGFLWRAPDGRFVRCAMGRAGREIGEPRTDTALGLFARADQMPDACITEVDLHENPRLRTTEVICNTEFTRL